MKKALLVGINAYPTSPLRGCLNDVEDWHKVLTSTGKYAPDNVRVVADERATTQGIRDRMAWLKEGITGPGDEVLFAYSGHGSQVRDRGAADELADHMDEILCPVDLDWNSKVITDDDLGEWLKGFPAGTRILVILDCCHSGTGTRDFRPPVENPHYKADRYIHPPIDIALRAEGLKQQKDVSRVRFGHGFGQRVRAWRETKEAQRATGWWSWLFGSKPKPRPKPVIPAAPQPVALNHVLISGCRSDQTSADAFINGRYNGALTRFVINEIAKGGNRSVAEIHAAARAAILSAGYAQESQLEGPANLLSGPMFA